jgi:hypothetical protein
MAIILRGMGMIGISIILLNSFRISIRILWPQFFPLNFYFSFLFTFFKFPSILYYHGNGDHYLFLFSIHFPPLFWLYLPFSFLPLTVHFTSIFWGPFPPYHFYSMT